MSTRDLIQNLSIDRPPQIYEHYASAHKKVFHKSVYLPRKSWSTFAVFEDDLRNLGYDSKDYAYTIIKSLQNWAKSKALTFIPAGVFCGKWALERYKKIHDSKTVQIQTTEADAYTELLYSELMAARKYVSDKLAGLDIPFGYSVKSVAPMLSDAWLDMYRNHPVCEVRCKLIHEALTTICAEYGVPKTTSYSAAVAAIKDELHI